ncbi:non-heme dioxygenase in morphine synthesis N-terminal-domain-containing protein [Halenospora varia]|nr:non-heme dioxygenase in morphine synthesis N-terminal-domain-containing protein [Halenospora varia]
MTIETISQTSTGEYTTLKLSSANGPVYRKIRKTPVRDARLDEIPVIDVAGMFSSSLEDRKEVAQAIHDAATNNGFFYIKNHQIPPLIIDSAYQSSLEFFRQPDEIKEKVNAKLSPGFTGWKPPNTQRIYSAKSIDVRESFSIRYNPKYDPAIKDDLDAIPAEARSRMTEDEFLISHHHYHHQGEGFQYCTSTWN